MGKTEVTGKQIKDSSVDLTVDITGVLPVANGGSGSNTIALNNVVLGNGNGAVQTVAPGASGNVLRSNGTTWASSSLAQSDVSGLTTALSGKEPIINGGSTGQYWRGDKTWQTLNKTAVGLENVDNTSDANKPISTSTQTALNSKESTANKGVANGYASLDGGGKVPITQLPSSIMEYQGVYNATTNSPSLVDGTGNTGDVYRVSVAGTRNFGSGSITLRVGDYVIYNGSVWQKSATTDAVASVAGKTGDVTLAAADITTGTFALSKLTTTGTASSSTFLRGDGAWETLPPSGITRSVQTITTPTTLGAAANTDYIIFSNIAADSSFPSTVALLEFNAANNSTTFTDSSPLAANFTSSGGSPVISTTQKKFGTASLYLSSSSIRSSAATSNFGFGTADFTIDAWVYTTTGNGAVWYFGVNNYVYVSSGTLRYQANNSDVITGTASAVTTNTWHHVALCKSSTSTRLFLNGVQTGSTYTDNLNYSAAQVSLGARNFGDTFWNGYIDSFRITKGFARYTANFTPPTEISYSQGTITLPTAVSNTNMYTVKNISTYCTLSAPSGQTIDSTNTVALSSGGAVLRVISDGANWRTV